jgi:hypothetical protein
LSKKEEFDKLYMSVNQVFIIVSVES